MQPDAIYKMQRNQSPLGQAYLAMATKNVKLLKGMGAVVDVYSFFTMLQNNSYSQVVEEIIVDQPDVVSLMCNGKTVNEAALESNAFLNVSSLCQCGSIFGVDQFQGMIETKKLWNLGDLLKCVLVNQPDLILDVNSPKNQKIGIQVVAMTRQTLNG
jgi:hypothetical protein